MHLSFNYNANLAPYCSIKAGGFAKYLFVPKSIEELKTALECFRDKGKRIIVLGNATNVIFADDMFDGAVIFTNEIDSILLNNNCITAYCGASLSAIAKTALANSLTGLEFTYGIPGTVGGGVYMNAGAFGGEISDCFKQALCLTPELKEIILTKDDMDFSYRKSILQQNGYILLNATFSLSKGNAAEIKDKMDGYINCRKEKQPLEYPSCGSVFKRPQSNYAGALIEKCGLKGYTIGDAEVSEKHAGFIINKNKATAKDILKLIYTVSDTVYEKTGVRLEPEVRIIYN